MMMIDALLALVIVMVIVLLTNSFVNLYYRYTIIKDAQNTETDEEEPWYDFN